MCQKLRCPKVWRLAVSYACLVAGLGCCPAPVPLDEPNLRSTDARLEEPLDSFLYLCEAVNHKLLEGYEVARPAAGPTFDRGRPNRVYFLLVAGLRDRVPYHEFVAAWPRLQEKFAAEFSFSRRVIHQTSVPPVRGFPAVELDTVIRKSPGEPTDPRESSVLLFVREFDPLRWPQEKEPGVWRLGGAKAEELLAEVLNVKPQ